MVRWMTCYIGNGMISMTRRETPLTGYVYALFTILVWGSTFISTKLLLQYYTPAQIMLTRFLLAYGALWLLRRMSRGLDPILVTRRTMFWGAVTALPMVLLQQIPYPAVPLLQPTVIGNFLFLGLIGSALCFVLWNKAFRILGVVATNNFIYLNPFVTIVAAWLFLREPISPLALLGAALITAGVVISQRPAKPLLGKAAKTCP